MNFNSAVRQKKRGLMQERFETFTVLINRISRNIRKIKNQEMEEKSRILTNMVDAANEDFSSLNLSISEMVSGNNVNAEESSNISAAMSDMVDFCNNIKAAFDTIQAHMKDLSRKPEDYDLIPEYQVPVIWNALTKLEAVLFTIDAESGLCRKVERVDLYD